MFQFIHLFHDLLVSSMRFLLNNPCKVMRSQSISAQLLRMTAVLGLTLALVNHFPPLLNAFSDNGAEVGCHQIPKSDKTASVSETPEKGAIN